MLHELFVAMHGFMQNDVYVCIKQTEHSCVFMRIRDGEYITLGPSIIPVLLKQLTRRKP